MVYDVFKGLTKLTKKAKITDAIYEFADSFDNIQLLDKRTEEMFLSYEFYKNNPEKAYNIVSAVWFSAYCLINQYQPRIILDGFNKRHTF